MQRTMKSKVDIVERLRLGEGSSPDHRLLLEAASKIERLRIELKQTKTAFQVYRDSVDGALV